MDRLIYTAMTGASHTLSQQATVAQNLANAATTGYRAETNTFRAVPVFGAGAPTRTFVVDSTPGADFTPGILQQTGRDLDVAIQGDGWVAVQGADGKEAYTRNGSFQISPNGELQTRTGLNVQGDSIAEVVRLAPKVARSLLGVCPSNTNFLLGQPSEGTFGVQKVGFRTRKYPLVRVKVITLTDS